MRHYLITLASAPLLLATPAGAIPQNFAGFFFSGQPLRPIEEDITDELTTDSVWVDGELPLQWTSIPALDGEEVKQLNVAPKVLGERPQVIFANLESGRLRSISLLYLDAGQHYGYKPDAADVKKLKREFKKRYAELEKNLSKSLAAKSDGRPEETSVGRSAFLRASYEDYPLDDLTLRFSAIEGHSISVTILRKNERVESYLDQEIAKLDKRDRREALLANVEQQADGDTALKGIPMFQQGRRPYCAVSTLGMATYYLGLRMGTDALAAGAKFRGTGSAKGGKVLELYKAAADEADAGIQRGGSFDFERAQKAIDKGFPVVVWRRYDSERNRLHSGAARGGSLPEPDKSDRETWPTTKDAPGHSSVITGYNAETKEVIFSESWGEHTRDKRMRAEELEATSYAVFYFKV